MISARGVSFAVSGRNLVHDIHLDIEPGRLTVVIGPNGAGKSTLFRLMTGEIKPTSGRVEVGEQDARQLPAHALARLRAVVPQHTSLAFPFVVSEVVELGITVPGLMASGGRARMLAMTMLERVGLEGLADRNYATLSGGERQRVHIARALAQLVASDQYGKDQGAAPESSALLVDEPTSSLDIAHQLIVLAELRREAAKGRAVLAILHDLNLAASNADKIVVLAEGRQLAAGRPAEVLSDELLSIAYGCEIRLNRTPAGGVPYILPQVCAAGRMTLP